MDGKDRGRRGEVGTGDDVWWGRREADTPRVLVQPVDLLASDNRPVPPRGSSRA